MLSILIMFFTLDAKLYLSKLMPIFENGCTVLIRAATIHELGNSFIDYLFMSPRLRYTNSRRS